MITTNHTAKQHLRLILMSAIIVASWNILLTSSFIPNHHHHHYHTIDNHHAPSVVVQRYPITTTTLQQKNPIRPPFFKRQQKSVMITWQSKSSDTEQNKKKEDNDGTSNDMNPLTKASWYAVEAFGQIFGNNNEQQTKQDKSSSSFDLSQKPSSINEALRRIEMDNERSYFLSGLVDVEAYDENCIFSDPFVSFAGRQRFVDNLANLGSFITEYDARMLKYDQNDSGTTVQTKLMVKLRLNLPWQPVLAWPWGVRYTINPDTFLITDHEESWDIAPWEGVKQIFRPGTLEITKRDR